MSIFKRICNLFTPLEWVVVAIIALIALTAICNVVDEVAACGSQGIGPAAPNTCI